MQMLDLNTLKQETFDVKMLDGKIVHCKKPTQKMFLFFLDATNKIPEAKEAEIFKLIDDVIFMILNWNTDGREIKEIDSIDIDMKMAIVNNYAKFLNEILSRKN